MMLMLTAMGTRCGRHAGRSAAATATKHEPCNDRSAAPVAATTVIATGHALTFGSNATDEPRIVTATTRDGSSHTSGQAAVATQVPVDISSGASRHAGDGSDEDHGGANASSEANRLAHSNGDDGHRCGGESDEANMGDEANGASQQ